MRFLLSSILMVFTLNAEKTQGIVIGQPLMLGLFVGVLFQKHQQTDCRLLLHSGLAQFV